MIRRPPIVALCAVLSIAAARLDAQAAPGKTLAPAVVPNSRPAAAPTRSEVLFTENFFSFPTVSSDAGRSQASSDGLDVSAGGNPLFTILWDRGRLPVNYRVSVTVQVQREGRDHGGGGLTWGIPSRDAAEESNTMSVSPSGFLFVSQPGGDAAREPRRVAQVRRGAGSTNLLVVQCVGGAALLMVNGFVVDQLQGQTCAGYVGVYADPGSRVVFSNLRVERLY